MVLAGAVRNHDDVRDLEQAAGLTLRVVRLEVPLDEIARRLRPDPTTGRHDDLAAAEQWLADSIGVGVEHLSIANEGAIHDIALRIIDWLGWSEQ